MSDPIRKTPYTKGILIFINVLYFLTYSRMLGINIVASKLAQTLLLIVFTLVTPLIIFVARNQEQSLKKLQYYKITVFDKLGKKKNTNQ